MPGSMCSGVFCQSSLHLDSRRFRGAVFSESVCLMRQGTLVSRLVSEEIVPDGRMAAPTDT